MLTEERIEKKRIMSEKKLLLCTIISWAVALALALLFMFFVKGIEKEIVFVVYSGYILLSVMAFSFLSVKAHSNKRKKFEVRYFNAIDKLIGKKPTLAEKTSIIKRIYLPEGKVDELVKREGISVLVKRKAFLESKIFEKENLVTMPANFAFSIMSSLVASYIVLTISGGSLGWLFIILFVLFGVAMILTIVYYMSAKSDEDIVIFEIELMRVDEKLTKFFSAKS